jgi:hypothetical protein
MVGRSFRTRIRHWHSAAGILDPYVTSTSGGENFTSSRRPQLFGSYFRRRDLPGSSCVRYASGDGN